MRGTHYISLLKTYEHNLINRNNDNEEIRKLNKPKLCKIIKNLTHYGNTGHLIHKS